MYVTLQGRERRQRSAPEDSGIRIPAVQDRPGARSRCRRVRGHVRLEDVTFGYDPLSAPSSTGSASKPSPARRWPSSARPAPARAPSSRSCPVSSTRRGGECSSTGTTCATCNSKSVREQVALVLQEPFLFPSSRWPRTSPMEDLHAAELRRGLDEAADGHPAEVGDAPPQRRRGRRGRRSSRCRQAASASPDAVGRARGRRAPGRSAPGGGSCGARGCPAGRRAHGSNGTRPSSAAAPSRSPSSR